MNSTTMKIFVPAIAFLLTTAVLLFVRSVVFRLLRRWAEREDTRLDTIVVTALKGPSLYWCIAIGLFICVDLSNLPARYSFYIDKSIYLLIILSITLTAANVSDNLLNTFTQKSSLPISSTGLANWMSKATILVLGFLIALSVIGISITPLITALGIGGLAVALAFQDTLANLFAGIYLLMEKTIRVGDFIRIENGQEGYVEDISWRTTRIRMLTNNMIVIPNSKLSQNIVVNYSMPEKRMSVSIPVRVSRQSDPETVERVLADELGKAVAEIPEILSDPRPMVQFIPGVGDNALEFTLSCQIKEFANQSLVQHELKKRVFYRLKKEGIELPVSQIGNR